MGKERIVRIDEENHDKKWSALAADVEIEEEHLRFGWKEMHAYKILFFKPLSTTSVLQIATNKIQWAWTDH